MFLAQKVGELARAAKGASFSTWTQSRCVGFEIKVDSVNWFFSEIKRQRHGLRVSSRALCEAGCLVQEMGLVCHRWLERRRTAAVQDAIAGKGSQGVAAASWIARVLSRFLSQQRIKHMAMDVCQPAFDAVVLEGEAFVVEAEEVKDGGVEIVNG